MGSRERDPVCTRLESAEPWSDQCSICTKLDTFTLLSQVLSACQWETDRWTEILCIILRLLSKVCPKPHYRQKKKKKKVFIHFFSHLEKDREETDLDETLNYSAEVCSIFSLWLSSDSRRNLTSRTCNINNAGPLTDALFFWLHQETQYSCGNHTKQEHSVTLSVRNHVYKLLSMKTYPFIFKPRIISRKDGQIETDIFSSGAYNHNKSWHIKWDIIKWWKLNYEILLTEKALLCNRAFA